MAEQYRGQFKSLDGVLYTAIISNSNYSGSSQEIPHFESEGEVEISWKECDKFDVIQGSEAKLRVISESDRRFIDLYTEVPGSIRLDIYKNETPDTVSGIGSLYWSGCLDCEFYEEPYSSEKNYAVELTFSDFGILDRLKFDMTNVTPITLQSILSRALTKSFVSEITFNDTLISLNKTLSEINIYAANFYDEDGVASSWSDVVKQILQPLSIKMVQRNGVVYLYDLHSLYNSNNSTTIEWKGNNATLGVDKVYNNLKITFSPYVVSTVVDGDLDLNPQVSNLGGEGTNYHTYYKGYHYDSDDEYNQKKEGDKDFTLYVDLPTTTYIKTDCPICAFRKVYGGEDSEFAAGVYTTQDPNGEPNIVEHAFTDYTSDETIDHSIIKTKKILLPGNGNCSIRIKAELFADVRYNPFREGAKTNEKGNYERSTLKGTGSLFVTPFRARLYDGNGNVLYHYMNNEYTRSATTEDGAKFAYKGAWSAGDYHTDYAYWNQITNNNDIGFAFLAWYDPADKGSSILNNGWKTNYQYYSRNQYMADADPLIASAPAGQYIPYPPSGGYLEVEIFGDFRFYCYPFANAHDSDWLEDNYDYIRWLLVKAPVIELTETTSPYNVLESSDIETNGLIDENAKEDLELDFSCGTPSSTVSNANGAYVNSSGVQFHSFTRAGRTDTAEQLFIGTCFSQYASRNTTLSGDVKIDTGALKPYADPYISNRYNNGVATPTGESKKFMMVEDVQKLSEDISDTKFVEFMQDIYTKG